MDYIIIGLGNPGARYESTKHNMGFIAVDILAERHGIKVNRIRHRALTGEGIIFGQKVLLIKPQTYMNLSGESVRNAVDYYKAPHDRIIVIYDDIDIPIGYIRVRQTGGPGSHNGMRSVVLNLCGEDFPRIRIGINDGQTARGEALTDYVLGGFRKQDKDAAETALLKAADAAECILRDGVGTAMNRYNARSEVANAKASGEDAEIKKGGSDDRR
ncbi:MAG: aminoacyl-tRNA hydrolase [Clostridiales Family XIII bacterium]|jgi:PTH1 family peptidyl-tRNA hydrolase|nr:aminoacyl-tRNA hydrolase [Clostridiales Family XIII bacterium]